MLDHSSNLDELFEKYGSDKNRNRYTPVYHSLFKNMRDDDVQFLEIGIGTMIPGVPSSMKGYALPGYTPGGSLRAWSDYFPKGNIVGIDVQPDTQFREERIMTFLANSTVKDEVDLFMEKRSPFPSFDVILDDGDHNPLSQYKTFCNFYPYVKKGGFYIIEDIGHYSPLLTKEFIDKFQEGAKDAFIYAAHVWEKDGSAKVPILIISKR